MKKIFISLVAVSLLSGCSGSGTTASNGTSSPSSVETAVASKSVQKSPSAQPLVDESQWFLTADYFGPIKMGQPQPEGYRYKPAEACSGPYLLNSAGTPMAELETAESGEVHSIFLSEHARTKENIAIGDTLEKAQKAYPKAERRTIEGVDSLVVQGSGGRVLLLEIIEGKVAFISAQSSAVIFPVSVHECEQQG